MVFSNTEGTGVKGKACQSHAHLAPAGQSPFNLGLGLSWAPYLGRVDVCVASIHNTHCADSHTDHLPLLIHDSIHVIL